MVSSMPRTWAALLILAAGLPAGISPPLGADKPDVQARLLAAERQSSPSKSVIVVEMRIGPGWHVNSHTPSEKFLIPTTVVLTSSAGAFSPVRYPKDVEKRFSFSPKPLRVYEGTVRFETDLELPAGAAGAAEITGGLDYQACNQNMCFAPARIPLEARITVAPKSSR
jgi:DsbC/DsbD-like thiol-disulfide interchange protein